MTTNVICIDANFVVRLLTDATQSSRFWELWNQWQGGGYQFVAPTLFYYKISNAIHRMAIAGQLIPEESKQALEAALNLNIELQGDPQLHQRAVEMARSLGLPAAYDAHYLALADRLGVQLYTADRRLAQAVRTTLPWVNLVE